MHDDFEGTVFRKNLTVHYKLANEEKSTNFILEFWKNAFCVAG